MLILVELEGAILDVRPGYWHAYSKACEALSLPRAAPDEFWRLVRIGAPTDQWSRGALPGRLARFPAVFEEQLEQDESLALAAPWEEIGAILDRLKRHGNLTLVTMGGNRAARQAWLDRERLAERFLNMRGLARDASGRRLQLEELMGEADRVLLVASSYGLARSGSETGIFTVGIYSGSATGKRLSLAGAGLIFADLAALADELDRGGTALTEAGMRPAKREGSLQSPFVAPVATTRRRR